MWQHHEDVNETWELEKVREYFPILYHHGGQRLATWVTFPDVFWCCGDGLQLHELVRSQAWV
jgi:hypothetical protein